MGILTWISRKFNELIQFKITHIYGQGEIHAPNSTALFAFTILLLVVIAILLGVLEGILDVGVVGVNTGERSEKL